MDVNNSTQPTLQEEILGPQQRHCVKDTDDGSKSNSDSDSDSSDDSESGDDSESCNSSSEDDNIEKDASGGEVLETTVLSRKRSLENSDD